MYKLPSTFSPQQQIFIDWCRDGSGSCILESVAGSGKSTTLLGATVELCRAGEQVAILAYNAKIAAELKQKLKDLDLDWKQAQAGTVHSFGWAACRKAFPGIVLSEWKVRDLIDEYVFFHEKEMDVPSAVLDVLLAFKPTVAKLVSMAKQRAVGVIGSIDDLEVYREILDHYELAQPDMTGAHEPLICQLASVIMKMSNIRTAVADFDDQVYFPLIHKLRMWQFPFVFVDEAQDLSAARRALVRALCRKGGRVAGIGDRHQSIYGFSGADNDSLDRLKSDFSAIELPLTVTYRCPKKVVEFSHQWVSHIQALETANEGMVSEITLDEFVVRRDLDGSSAVLSRTTKPLVVLAFKLIRAKIACKIEGRAIGEGLKKLATRWSTISTTEDLLDKLEEYLARETTKLLAKKQEAKLQNIEDQVDTLNVIIDQCKQHGKHHVDDVISYIDALFAEEVRGILVLSTIHKAKGREWKTVFWLDRRGTCPSKWARQAWMLEQERNLCYVATTRSLQNLIEVTVPG